VLDHLGSWDEILPLVEFTYNNNYQASIGMLLLKHCMVESVEHLYVGFKMVRVC